MSDSRGEIKALTFQSIYMIESGALSTILPLLMREEGLSIGQIGIVYSIEPMLFQLTRLFLGALSDFVGRKPFFVLNGIGSSMSFVGYYLAKSPIGFTAGKILTALQGACIWAVNRAYLLEQKGGGMRSLFKMRALTAVFGSAGSFLAGFLVSRILYRRSLLALIPFSLVNILISLSLKETVERRSPDIKKVLKQVDPGGRCSGFIKFIGLFCLAGFSIGITWAYVIPLYLKSMGLTVEMIGALLGLQSLASGFTLYILSSKIEYKGFLLFSGAYSSAGIVLFGLADRSTILPLSFMLGTASGAMGAVHEAVIGKITREGSYGADIGLLMLGLHAGNTVAQAVSGYLISYLGYSLLFCLSALASLTFSVLAYLRISKNKKGD